MLRTAACRCGAVQAECEGEPVRVSVCNCLICQRRTGSAFGAQARFPVADVKLTGATKTYIRMGPSGHQMSYQFCPECGATVIYRSEGAPDVVVIPIGAFADPSFPPPRFSIYEGSKHPWTVVQGDDVEHSD